MKWFNLIALTLFFTASVKGEEAERKYTAMIMSIKNPDTGKMETEHFFEGPIPEVGQCAEYKYMGLNSEGQMQFQMHAKKCGE